MAKIRKTTISKEVVTVVEEKGYNLQLTEGEALLILCLLGRCTGAVTESIYGDLIKAGVPQRYLDIPMIDLFNSNWDKVRTQQ